MTKANANDPHPPRVVVDTNVALDWLVFADPQVQALRQAVEAGHVTWWATPAMRDELAHMLKHRDLSAWMPDAAAALATFDRWVHMAPMPATACHGALRCRDPDDQGFIDLALGCQARWLLTRDRAVLALAKPARARGVEIVTPARWAAAQTAAL